MRVVRVFFLIAVALLMIPTRQAADAQPPLSGFNEGYAQRLPEATHAERELNASKLALADFEQLDPAAREATLRRVRAAASAFQRAQGRDDERLSSLIADSRDGGAQVARFGIVWGLAEPRPGRFNWAYYDSVYQRLLASGIRPLLVLVDSPAWARPTRPRLSEAFAAWYPDRGFELEWGRFAAAVAERYPESVAIEVWNEPNSWTFWGGRPDPQHYTELLRTAYRAIKGVRPQMPVLLAAPAPRIDKSFQWDQFLRRAYAHGAAAYSDDLSVHPYATEDGPQLRQVLDLVWDADELIREHHPGARIWVTEVGFPTDPRARNAVSELRQAELLASVHRRLPREAPVRAVLIHRVREIDSGDPTEDSYGVTRAGGQRKPGFCALVVSLLPNRLC